MKKYRRIEANAYHRRVTVVSGEWRPADLLAAQPDQTDDGVLLNDSDACEPVAADSPEGQLIIAEAVRTLEQRLSPEGRALIFEGQNTLAPKGSNRKGFYLKLQSFFRSVLPSVLRFARKEN